MTGYGGRSAQSIKADFTDNEDCFYGRFGMYGAGIYAAVNKAKQNPPPPNSDYQIAFDYAGYDADSIIDIALTPDAKVIDANELDQMMNDEFFGEEFKEKKKEYDDLKLEVDELVEKANNIEKTIAEDTKNELGWNQKVLNALNSRADIVYADPEVHSFGKVKRYYETLAKTLGATIEEYDGGKSIGIELPLSSENFILSETVAGRSLKQKNQFTKPYNYHYQNFDHQNYLYQNYHYQNYHYRNYQCHFKRLVNVIGATCIAKINFYSFKLMWIVRSISFATHYPKFSILLRIFNSSVPNPRAVCFELFYLFLGSNLET